MSAQHPHNKLTKVAVGAVTEAPKLLTVAIVTGIGMAIGTVIGHIIISLLGLDKAEARFTGRR